MDHSLYGANRKAHVKIIAVGLLCAGLFVAVGKFANLGAIDLGTEPLFKAGQPVVVSGHLPAIR